MQTAGQKGVAAQRLIRSLEADGEPTRGIKAALAHAVHGFSVFPVAPNGKEPAVEFWRELATGDEAQIMQWWARLPNANVGIATAGLLVVDVDPPHGGSQTFAAIVEQHGALPDTIAVTTQSGGAHLYFKLPHDAVAFGGLDVLGRGVDVRASDGYVVAPGSAIEGRPYSWRDGCSPAERELAVAPGWLVDACSVRRSRSLRVGQQTVTDDDTALGRALQYLDYFAPEAIGPERHKAATCVAERLWSYGLSAETGRVLLGGLWSRFDCYPPLPPTEIEAIASGVESSIA